MRRTVATFTEKYIDYTSNDALLRHAGEIRSKGWKLIEKYQNKNTDGFGWTAIYKKQTGIG